MSNSYTVIRDLTGCRIIRSAAGVPVGDIAALVESWIKHHDDASPLLIDGELSRHLRVNMVIGTAEQLFALRMAISTTEQLPRHNLPCHAATTRHAEPTACFPSGPSHPATEIPDPSNPTSSPTPASTSPAKPSPTPPAGV